MAAPNWRQATRASPLRGHHPDARSGRRRRADKADTSSEDGRHRWSSRATPLGVVAASTWLPHTVRRPDLALKYHRPCEAHEGSSGHVTMRDRRAYYLSRPPTAWDLLASRSVRAARLVLSDHGVGLFAAEGAQAIVAVRRVSARTACSRCGTDRGSTGTGGDGLGASPTPLPVERHSRRFGRFSRVAP